MADSQTAEKKAKPPTLEDKPFAEFIELHLIPSLQEALQANGMSDVTLQFLKKSLPTQTEESWQVWGEWAGGTRSFLVGFPEESISGVKVFACADGKSQHTDLEPFLGDERKITLDLLVFGVVRRLNGQKWLGLN